MYKVTAKQRLTKAQIKLAEDREAQRVKFRLWESGPEREWEWDEVKGLRKKRQSGGGGGRRRRRRGGGGRRRILTAEEEC